MSILDDFISALGKATEIIDPRIGGGIIPLLAQEPQKKTELIAILAALHEVLGVAEHFSSGAAKTIEEVADEIIETIGKQDGAD